MPDARLRYAVSSHAECTNIMSAQKRGSSAIQGCVFPRADAYHAAACVVHPVPVKTDPDLPCGNAESQSRKLDHGTIVRDIASDLFYKDVGRVRMRTSSQKGRECRAPGCRQRCIGDVKMSLMPIRI